MKTLEELNIEAQQAKERYFAVVSAAESMCDEATRAAADAEAAARLALEHGDNEAFTKANHEAEYNRKRADELSARTVSPLYTVKEYNGIISELNSAVWAEEREIYKRFYELQQEWARALADLRKLKSRAAHIGNTLRDTGVPTGMRGSDYQLAPMVLISREVEKVAESYALTHTISTHYKAK